MTKHHTNRWSLAEPGECEYCGGHAPVLPDPFGQTPACKTCWELIAYGEDDE